MTNVSISPECVLLGIGHFLAVLCTETEQKLCEAGATADHRARGTQKDHLSDRVQRDRYHRLLGESLGDLYSSVQCMPNVRRSHHFWLPCKSMNGSQYLVHCLDEMLELGYPSFRIVSDSKLVGSGIFPSVLQISAVAMRPYGF